MALLDRVKLKKLMITAYKTRLRTGAPVGRFEALFNPDTFSQKYEITYGPNQSLNSAGKQANYSYSKPRTLNLKLILDESGVQQMGIFQLKIGKSVADQVNEFLNLTFSMNGNIHEPNYLRVEWGGKEDGGLIFSCRLLSVNVTYTSFHRDGSPLRAELDINLISDEETQKRKLLENKSSPDLTHARIVKSGDTLPALTQEIYGSSEQYLRVAQINGIDNFRNLTPGQELIFPPLER